METQRLTLDTQIGEIARLPEWLAGLSLPDDVTFRLNLVLEEAVTNVIFYAQAKSPVEVTLTRLGDVVTVEIADDGIAFDPLQAEAPDTTLPADERPIGGLGILLVRSMSTTQTYRREHDRNILTLTFAV